MGAVIGKSALSGYLSSNKYKVSYVVYLNRNGNA